MAIRIRPRSRAVGHWPAPRYLAPRFQLADRQQDDPTGSQHHFCETRSPLALHARYRPPAWPRLRDGRSGEPGAIVGHHQLGAIAKPARVIQARVLRPVARYRAGTRAAIPRAQRQTCPVDRPSRRRGPQVWCVPRRPTEGSHARREQLRAVRILPSLSCGGQDSPERPPPGPGQRVLEHAARRPASAGDRLRDGAAYLASDRATGNGPRGSSTGRRRRAVRSPPRRQRQALSRPRWSPHPLAG